MEAGHHMNHCMFIGCTETLLASECLDSDSAWHSLSMPLNQMSFIHLSKLS